MSKFPPYSQSTKKLYGAGQLSALDFRSNAHYYFFKMANKTSSISKSENLVDMSALRQSFMNPLCS